VAEDPASGGNASENRPRMFLAGATITVSIVSILVLAVVIVFRDATEAMNVFNILVPVFASWVGTVLAFYFGRENFQTANEQARETNKQMLTMAQQAQPQAATKSVTEVMKPLADIDVTRIPVGGDDGSVLLSQMLAKFKPKINRMPVLDPEGKPKYMIHEASIKEYLADVDQALPSDSMETFLKQQAGEMPPLLYGNGEAFAVVKESATLAEAKAAMDALPRCLDVFITVNGTPDEPLTGWISNVRLSRYLRT
jgi:hypothetical protein